MLMQQSEIIEEREKVQIIYEHKSFSIKKKDIYNKVKNFVNDKKDSELSYILGAIIAMKAISLKNDIVHCYFQQRNLWAKRPELKIKEQKDLYNLLKEMVNFN